MLSAVPTSGKVSLLIPPKIKSQEHCVRVRPEMSSEPLLPLDDIPPPHCNEDGNKTKEEEGRGFFAFALSLSLFALQKWIQVVERVARLGYGSVSTLLQTISKFQ